jgi:STE24 endopeptidase
VDRAGAAGMSDAELAEAKRYGRLKLACALGDRAVNLAYLTAAAFGFAVPLDAWLQNAPLLASVWSLRLAALLLLLLAFQFAVSLPLTFYSGYVLERQFQLSTLTFGGWLWRVAKQELLLVVISLVMIVGLYWIIWTVGAAWWLIAAVAFFVVSMVLGQLAPVLILPLFYRIQKLDVPGLADRLARLAEGTGLSIEGVYRMDLSAETVKANAMLAGLGRTRRVLLGDTVLKEFQPDEIEVIFAHEIGHHVFRHMRTMVVVGVFSSAAGFWLCDRLLAGCVAWHGGAVDYAHLPVNTLPLLLWIVAIMEFLSEPLQNALSRRFERQSDRYALERTGMADAYRSAFQKLARQNKGDPNPHWLAVLLFHSHPPIAERLAMADEERCVATREET